MFDKLQGTATELDRLLAWYLNIGAQFFYRPILLNCLTNP